MVVVAATLQFVPMDAGQLSEDIRRNLQWRKAGTPFDEPCCGSVFRNPDPAPGGDRRTAGQLIDAAGLKGFTVGRAQVSSVHANYIVNLGGATAEDVRRVIEMVRERVHAAFGVELQLEVRLIG